MNLRPINEQEHLKQKQYHNSKKLAARIRLHVDYATKQGGIWAWFFGIVLKQTPSKAEVLEVGTGRGDMWLENINRIPVGWDITLTDFSEGMLADNKNHLGELSKRMTYDVVDVQDIPYADNRFDVVFANMMLYHVPDRPKAIVELRRVLKPDGVLFSMTNGDNHMKKIYVIARQVDEIGEWDSVFKDSFSLQNGEAQLRQQFSDVQIQNFENDLFVTDAQPIIDYIRSMVSIDGEAVVAQHEDAMRAELEAEIADKGGVRIKKETGTFISRNK